VDFGEGGVRLVIALAAPHHETYNMGEIITLLSEDYAGLKMYSDVLICQSSPNHTFSYISVSSSCSKVPQNPLKDPRDRYVIFIRHLYCANG
jgi:hypothetical protein